MLPHLADGGANQTWNNSLGIARQAKHCVGPGDGSNATSAPDEWPPSLWGKMEWQWDRHEWTVQVGPSTKHLPLQQREAFWLATPSVASLHLSLPVLLAVAGPMNRTPSPVRCFQALQKTPQLGGNEFPTGNLWISKTAADRKRLPFRLFLPYTWTHKFTPTISGVWLEQTWFFCRWFWNHHGHFVNFQYPNNWNRVMNSLHPTFKKRCLVCPTCMTKMCCFTEVAPNFTWVF